MKRINNTTDFELLFSGVFGDIERTTLSKIKNQKLRIELGGEGDDTERLKQALMRSTKVLQYCFSGKALWLRMILWSDQEESNLKRAGFDINKATKVLKQKGEDETLYIHFDRYSKLTLLPITKSIINLDMAEEHSANITCYFISFNSQLIVNIYDDRGLDIYTTEGTLLNNIKKEFSNWLM